ncbi:MAG TPA: hypothetical protein DER56_01075 [Thermosipho africanus]|nr:hypothetical protein [Thermosipho africanus]
MKKLLLITSLFPVYKGQTRTKISYALFNLAKEWGKYVNVKVITPMPFYYCILDRKLIFAKTKIDDVDNYFFYYLKLPKTTMQFFSKKTIQKIVKELDAEKYYPDVVISHIYNSFELAYKISDFYNSKFVLGIHQTDLHYLKKKGNKEKLRKYYAKAYKIACRSYPIYKKLSEIYPEYKEKMFIANFGISAEKIENKEFFFEKARKLAEKKEKIFITVASFRKLKNIDINIKALADFKDREWKYILIGDGPERKKIEKIVKKLKIEDRVIFKGYLENKLALEALKGSQIFVMVSAPETFGIAYLEAMAKANIVIGTKGWGIDGIIKNEYNGFLVEPRDIEDLKRVLNRIFEMDHQEAQRILGNVWDTITQYTEEKVAMNELGYIYSGDVFD